MLKTTQKKAAVIREESQGLFFLGKQHNTSK
jgi:hypothetical protein